MVNKQVHLAVLGLAPGAHQAAWRHPNVNPKAHVELEFFRQLVETAERGKFDLLFLADLVGPIGVSEEVPEVFERTPYGLLEPITLLSALSTYTNHLGLVATVSASIASPYQIARIVGSLDHLSQGRAGWNVVTTPLQIEESLKTEPLKGKESQYARAREVSEMVFDYWDTWADDSFPRDREANRFVRLDNARIPHREGEFYRVKGPLNQPRPPQGRPVIVQAGASDIGRDLAAHIADIAFTVQPSLESAKAFYKDMKERAERAGRDPDTVIVMPGIMPFVGKTAEEAQELKAQVLACLDPIAALGELKYLTDVDLTGYDLDGPIPDVDELVSSSRNSGFLSAIKKIRADDPDMTVLELLRRMSSGRGHPECVGSGADVADLIEEWVDEGAADGLLIQPPLLPDDFERFVDLVVPELQRRGRYRTEYEHTTLRGNLGIPVPARR